MPASETGVYPHTLKTFEYCADPEVAGRDTLTPAQDFGPKAKVVGTVLQQNRKPGVICGECEYRCPSWKVTVRTTN
ncbi:MAG: hypothetical protein KDI09_14270 [Halioglobus sp.]|nr:hypothetical protein [Halioglobus sp.]